MKNKENLLHFWFGQIPASGKVDPQRLKLWFGGDSSTDREIKEKFEHLLIPALAGDLDDWSDSPHGTLALIVLLDQFPRNIFRKTAEAFACDERALELALAGIDSGQDRALSITERAFFYMPLEHSESLEMQKLSVEKFEYLLEEAPEPLKKMCASFLDYAVRHKEIIERFGRYPHRNQALGRESTGEEVEFLKQPGSSF